MKKLISIMLALTLAMSLAACASNSKTDVSVNDIWEKYATEIPEDQRPSMQDLDETLLSDIYGISSDEYDEFVAKLALMNVNAEEIFIAKVKDGKMEDVKSKIMARQNALEEQWKMYLPDQYELVQNYKLVENGDYVLFAVSQNADKIVEIFQNSFK